MIETQKNTNIMDQNDSMSYQRTQMQREMIIEKLKVKGCRITKQRRILLDTILEKDCSSCKEIFYEASKRDDKIGTATVYRMVNILEEIGAINRKNLYKVVYSDKCELEEVCTVVLDDNTTYNLSAQKWNAVVRAGLIAYGYLSDQKITSITVKPCGSKCLTQK